MLQFPKTVQKLPILLTSVLSSALDPDSYAIVHETDGLEEVADLAIIVDESLKEDLLPNVSARLSLRPDGLTVAIVDRTADFEQAAETLVNARFGFHGRSAFAPDLVLVNEFAKQDLLQALVKKSLALSHRLDQSDPPADNIGREPALHEAAGRQIQRRLGQGTKLITESSQGSVFDAQQRTKQLLTQKINEAVLVIGGTSSLDDCVDFVLE